MAASGTDSDTASAQAETWITEGVTAWMQEVAYHDGGYYEVTRRQVIIQAPVGHEIWPARPLDGFSL
jgi:hypothetical protein